MEKIDAHMVSFNETIARWVDDYIENFEILFVKAAVRRAFMLSVIKPTELCCDRTMLW